MILLCGIPSEPPVRLAIEAAKRMRVKYLLFNQREAQYDDIFLDVEQGHLKGAIRIGEQTVPFHEVSGIYNRLIDIQQLPEYQSSTGQSGVNLDRVYKSVLVHDALIDWMETSEARVMNRNSDMLSNLSKPYQTQRIQEAGFLIPPTLITNDPADVKEFVGTYERVVYKSISSVRSIVKALDRKRMGELSKLHNLPTQFQAYIPGVNIRVHVTGSQVFATEVISRAIDYRYAGQEGAEVEISEIELPYQIEERCLELSRLLRLPLCGIDLKRTPEEDYYCFEVNPSPGYSYYQEHTGQAIADGIVRYLSEGDNFFER